MFSESRITLSALRATFRSGQGPLGSINKFIGPRIWTRRESARRRLAVSATARARMQMSESASSWRPWSMEEDIATFRQEVIKLYRGLDGPLVMSN